MHAAFASITILIAGEVHAATFDVSRTNASAFGGPPYEVSITGEIVGGDATRFRSILTDLSVRTELFGIQVSLDSPGGSVVEGLEIAGLINSEHLNTHVSGQCMSVCFALFAAGNFRSFAPGAPIGVHAAYTGTGKGVIETAETFAATMEIVRTVQTFKSFHPIPDAVLGKLVGTPGSPAKVTILSAADLLGMDAIMHPPGPSPRITPEIEQEARNDAARNISEEQGDLVGQWIKAYSEAYARGYSHFHCPHSRWNANTLPCIAGARDYAAAVGVTAFADEAIQGAKIPLAFAQLGLSKSMSSNSPVPLSLARQQGLADRQIYETWFNSLSVGEFRAGAEWWAANRSLKGSSCGAAPVIDERWLEGCKEANRRLSASDLRRKLEPEYRVGWNSF